MTKLYAASEDEKSAEAPGSDDELLRADEVGVAMAVAVSPVLVAACGMCSCQLRLVTTLL